MGLTIVNLDEPLAPVLPKDRIQHLADIIMTLQRCFMQHLSEHLSRGQLSFPQFFLLAHLGTERTMTMTEIAHRMNHTTAAATGLIDRLESLHYVERSHEPSDRRKIRVRITGKGAELVNLIREDFTNGVTKVMVRLTPEEQRMWLQIYEKILEFVRSQPQSYAE